MSQRKRLIGQLYPSYLLLVLIVLVATGWYASRAMRTFHMAQIHRNLLYQALFLEPQALPLIDPLDRKGLDRFCKRIVVGTPIRLTVVLPDGSVAGDSEADPLAMENHGERPEIRQAIQGDTGSASRFSDTLGQQMLYVAYPLTSDANTVQGVLRLSISLAAVDHQLHALWLRFGTGGLLIALTAAFVCLVIARRISRPLETMRRGAERFARGELSHRLLVPDTAEPAELAQAMNLMAQKLEQKMADIVQQRNESEAVLASMTEGVIALDPEERILHLNAAAVRLLRGDHTLQGRSIQEVIRNWELHRLIRTTLDQGVHSQADIALYHKGEQVLNTRCTPLFDASGRRMGALLVLSDVTQIRRLETMRSDFAANVSHEIKTPLTAIVGFVETLCEGVVTDPHEAQRFLQIILKHVKRLTTIVDDLMQLARLEQDGEGRQLVLRPGAISQLLQAAAQICRAEAAEKVIVIDIACAETLTAPIDNDLMEQAVVNLLNNAIKYSPPNSRISVSACKADDLIQIVFADQGIGIAQHHLPRLFERFYRVDQNRSRRMGGTGLGLAIVKHIVQAHGGQVSVESVEGQGSTFTLSLPAL